MTTPSSQLERAVAVLKNGGVIAMPTDTLYALSAVATDDEAVRRVYAIKGREDGKPLPLFVAGLAMAEQIAVFNDASRRLAAAFWPGALTLVLEKSPDFASEALAGGGTVALRVPANEDAVALTAAAGAPLTGTSANRSGGPDPATAQEVERQLGSEVDLIIDGGPCAIGVSSTIVDCTGETLRILRAGAISEAAIAAALA